MKIATTKVFTETRITEGVMLRDVDTLGYIGTGVLRSDYTDAHGVNAGSPYSLHLRARAIDGVFSGNIKVTKMKNCIGEWFSFRSIGGNRRTVYLRGDTRIIILGQTRTLSEFYSLVS